VMNDPTIAATLLRLAFHDSFTFDLESGKGGANGSIRLETGRGENSGLGRAVTALEGVQSKTGLGWGDLVAVAGAEAVSAAGGPVIEIALGRDDAETGDPQGALPSPQETVDELRARFAPRGFTDRDLVALSGAHTLGRVSGSGPFVKESNRFLNDYYVNLMWFQERREAGLKEDVGPPERPNFQLPSDMSFLDDEKTLAIVQEFAESQDSFFEQFKKSYNKMVNVGTPMASRA
jgi:cytochrome c peroxidase